MFFWSIIVYLLISTVSFAQNPPSRSGKSVFDFDKDSRIKRHSMAKLESPFFLERKDISDILTNILAENKPKDRFETTGDFKNRSNSFIKNFIFKKTNSAFISVDAFSFLDIIGFDYNADSKTIPVYSSAFSGISLKYGSREIGKYIDDLNFKHPTEIIEEDIASVSFEYDNAYFKDQMIYLDSIKAKENWNNIEIRIAGTLIEPYISYQIHIIQPSGNYLKKSHYTRALIHFDPKFFELRQNDNSDLIGVVKINKCSEFSMTHYTTEACR